MDITITSNNYSKNQQVSVANLNSTEKVEDITSKLEEETKVAGIKQNFDVVEISTEGKNYSSTESTDNLTSYSELELKKLVSEGTITQAQLDAEMTRRGKSDTNNSDETLAVGVTAQEED